MQLDYVRRTSQDRKGVLINLGEWLLSRYNNKTTGAGNEAVVQSKGVRLCTKDGGGGINYLHWRTLCGCPNYFEEKN